MNHQRVKIIAPEPHFTLFEATRSGKPEVVVVNDALRGFPHVTIFPWHLLVTIDAQELVENGMPSPSESEVLFRVGDEIQNLVLGGETEHNSQNALFLARSTFDGCRELLFQVHDPGITHTALQGFLASRTWERSWDYSIVNDQEWTNAAKVFRLFDLARGNDA